MHALDITDAKVIGDLCNKFQIKRSSLVPIFKPNEDEELLRNLNFKKLHDEVMAEQERLERRVR